MLPAAGAIEYCELRVLLLPDVPASVIAVPPVGAVPNRSSSSVVIAIASAQDDGIVAVILGLAAPCVAVVKVPVTAGRPVHSETLATANVPVRKPVSEIVVVGAASTVPIQVPRLYLLRVS